MTIEQKRAYQREWRRKNQDKCKAAQKRYHLTHQEQIKSYRERTKNAKAQQFRFRAYGLSPIEYETMLQEQDHSCAICYLKKALEIDHDHVTGKVRGLLCQECNLGLGKFKDSMTLLTTAQWYLQKHNRLGLFQ